MSDRILFDWSDEAVAEARRLWDEGISTAAIGVALGCSKNALIGKAHRFGFPARESPIKCDPNRPAKVRVIRLPHTPRPLPIAVDEPAPVLSTTHTCQWIEGEPSRNPRFCGAPSIRGQSWCPAHNARVWKPRPIPEIEPSLDARKEP